MRPPRPWNRLVVVLLCSPLHRLLSGTLLVISYSGRRSGREHTIPVMYARDGDRLIVLAADAGRKAWWRNFDGTPRRATIHERGRPWEATGVVLRDPQQLAAARGAYLRRFPKATAAAGRGVLLELRPTATRERSPGAAGRSGPGS